MDSKDGIGSRVGIRGDRFVLGSGVWVTMSVHEPGLCFRGPGFSSSVPVLSTGTLTDLLEECGTTHTLSLGGPEPKLSSRLDSGLCGRWVRSRYAEGTHE